MSGKFHERKLSERKLQESISSKNENSQRENSKIKTPRLQTPEGNYKTFAVKPVSITTRFVIKQQDPTIPKCLNYLVCVCFSKILLKQSIMLLSPPLKPKEIQLREKRCYEPGKHPPQRTGRDSNPQIRQLCCFIGNAPQPIAPRCQLRSSA